tara:strand:- start:1064 stop:1279 length:216 start_codon:yes stop_codon:yes gene_type:complete
LHTQKKKDKKSDPCPVCDKELYFNEDYSSRAGLLDNDENCIGWMCPFCYTEFDFSNRVTYIMPMENERGIT